MRVGVSTRAEYAILQADLPGRPIRNIGVIWFAPAEGTLRFRLAENWDQIAGEDDQEVLESLAQDFSRKVQEFGPEGFLAWLEDSLSNALRLTARRPAERTLDELFAEHVEPPPPSAKVLPFVTHLPRIPLRAAATRFGEDLETGQDFDDWVPAPPGLRLSRDMFVAQVVGRSMEPLIPDGSWCVFRCGVVGSRQGKRLLIQRLGATGTSAEFTVKRYSSQKQVDEYGEWRHMRIRLEPLNPSFEPMEFSPEDEAQEFRVIGEFVRVL